ncbi:DUF3301 domain-containing protein [Endozoicomonas sp. G2_2]|uniref:DUF3301 domain-containing protein n=1 Tax=Endozoicomonas sp. G2_2 TaxID=2821092 RepID=UPI001AD9EE5A|nr:DUF3301 domain-containing protein [Endozoicomonas sp. G2_2]MBO9470639.1 DUF3301 domain-containing protein [Endozoicomonas sp. G2_2]
MFDFFPWLIGLSILGLFWWQSLGARWAARRAALRACEDAEVTFIDELAFQRLSFARGTLKRRYRFEFYRRGDRRYTGWVDMRGQRVEHVEMDPHPFGPDMS